MELKVFLVQPVNEVFSLGLWTLVCGEEWIGDGFGDVGEGYLRIELLRRLLGF